LACSKLKEKIAEKAAEKAVEQATGQDVDLEDGRVTVKDDKGNKAEFGAGAKVPKDWPALLAPYPGSNVVASYSARKSARLSGSLSLTTTDAAEKVFGHYESKLSGFTLKSETNYGGTQIKQFEKDGRRVAINVIPNDDVTRINLIATNF
jgi:hypothetical protein